MKKINIVLGLTFAILFTFCFFCLKRSEVNTKIVEFDQEFSVNSKTIDKKIFLPQKSDYIVQLKYLNKDTDWTKVVLNGEQLTIRFSKESEEITAQYYFIPKDAVNLIEDSLVIRFYPNNPSSVDMRITNYVKSISSDNGLLLTRNSFFKEKDRFSVKSEGIFFLCIFILWILLVYGGVKYFRLLPGQSIYNAIITMWPNLFFLTAISIISLTGPFGIVFKPLYLFLIILFSTVSTNVCLNTIAWFFLRHLPRHFEQLNGKIGDGGKLFITIGKWARKLYNWEEIRTFRGWFEKISNNEKTKKIIECCGNLKIWEFPSETFENRGTPVWIQKAYFWIKTRDLADKFILIFIFLLALSGLCFVFDLISCAENIAMLTYLFLIMGVIMKIFRCNNEKNA